VLPPEMGTVPGGALGMLVQKGAALNLAYSVALGTGLACIAGAAIVVWRRSRSSGGLF